MGSHQKLVARIVDAARAAECSRLSAQGKTCKEIAEQLGIGVATVDRDLKWSHGMYLQQNVEWRQKMIAEQMLKLDYYEQEAMEEWHRSRKMAIEQTNEVSDGDKGSTTKSKRKKKGRIGDSRLLKVALECIEQRREMLGLDLPEQTIDDLDREAQDPLVVEVTTRDAAKMVMSSRDGRVAVRITDSPPTVAPSLGPALTVDALPVEPSPVIGQTVAPSDRQDQDSAD